MAGSLLLPHISRRLELEADRDPREVKIVRPNTCLRKRFLNEAQRMYLINSTILKLKLSNDKRYHDQNQTCQGRRKKTVQCLKVTEN